MHKKTSLFQQKRNLTTFAKYDITFPAAKINCFFKYQGGVDNYETEKNCITYD